MPRASASSAEGKGNEGKATRREIWALEKELAGAADPYIERSTVGTPHHLDRCSCAERNVDDQDATTLKDLIDKSTVITRKSMHLPPKSLCLPACQNLFAFQGSPRDECHS